MPIPINSDFIIFVISKYIVASAFMEFLAEFQYKSSEKQETLETRPPCKLEYLLCSGNLVLLLN